MSRRSQRQLRNNVACTSYENIFRNEGYILNSGCQHLPEDIFKKVNKFSSLTCDQINSLTFVKNQPHENTLNKMKQALASQTKMINNNLNFQMRQMRLNDRNEDSYAIKSIKSEEILNNQGFKNDLFRILQD